MIFNTIIVSGGVNSTDGYVCAAGKISEEPGFTDFLFGNLYNRNVKLSWTIFHQRQEFKFEKLCWAEVL